jgi:hypothetical protein
MSGNTPSPIIQVDLIIDVLEDGETFHVNFEHYRLVVIPNHTIRWRITINGFTPLENEEVSASIFGFTPTTMNTPASPFAGFFAYGAIMGMTLGKGQLQVEIESQEIQKPPAGTHQWEYVIYILSTKRDVLGKIDPLVVVSG